MVINPIVGVYIPIIRIPIKGGMTGPSPIQGVFFTLAHVSSSFTAATGAACGNEHDRRESPRSSSKTKGNTPKTVGKAWWLTGYTHTRKMFHGWNLQITHLERNMVFQTSMIMFHVNLPGCNHTRKIWGHWSLHWKNMPDFPLRLARLVDCPWGC